MVVLILACCLMFWFCLLVFWFCGWFDVGLWFSWCLCWGSLLVLLRFAIVRILPCLYLVYYCFIGFVCVLFFVVVAYRFCCITCVASGFTGLFIAVGCIGVI